MTPEFDVTTREETIAAFVSACASGEELLELLPEQHPLYAGRSTNETTRIRGFALAAFARTGLPEAAVPFALEELESGHDPYTVAAAARALRGAAPDPRFAAYLRKAKDNIRYRDAPLTFDEYKPRWPVANATTATREIDETLAWTGDDGDCCGVTFAPARSRRRAALRVPLEDQEGRAVEAAEFFRGTLSVVAFFYTRCDNPQKCSLTIAQLARLQEAIEASALRDRVRLAAITYDPAYDLPSRMKEFGASRGMRFGDDVRFLRAPARFDELRAQFDLGVNFTGSLVNRHRIELFVLDARGNVVATFTRMQWDVRAVMTELERVAAQPDRAWKIAYVSLPAILLALLPKCPLCLGAYFTAFGIGGLQFLAQRTWTVPAAIVLLALHVGLVHRRARRTGNILAVVLALTGAVTLLASLALSMPRGVAWAGAALIALVSFLSSVRPANASYAK